MLSPSLHRVMSSWGLFPVLLMYVFISLPLYYTVSFCPFISPFPPKLRHNWAAICAEKGQIRLRMGSAGLLSDTAVIYLKNGKKSQGLRFDVSPNMFCYLCKYVFYVLGFFLLGWIQINILYKYKQYIHVSIFNPVPRLFPCLLSSSTSSRNSDDRCGRDRTLPASVSGATPCL